MRSGKEISRTKAEARQRKLTKIKSKQRVRIAVAVATVLIVLVGVRLAYDSSLFSIDEIKISGTVRISADQVLKMSGVKKGENLLKVSTGAIADRIRKNSWVKSVDVSRQLLGTLVIDVVERKPFAVVAAKKGLFYLDADGWVTEKASSSEAASLPRITDIPVDAKVGQRLASESLSNALSCLRSLDRELLDRVGMISGSTQDKLLIVTRDNIEILYGRAEDVSKKNQVIKAILAEKKGKLIFMDVRTATNPIVKRLDAPVAQ